MKKVSCSVALLLSVVVVVMVVLLGDQVGVTEAVTCNPMELSPCAVALTSGTPPSEACCTKLKEQEPCFCQYMKDPSLKPYVNSPNAKKVADACHVTLPTSC